MKYPAVSHSHFSGHSTATFAGRITNHSQNATAGAANSSDISTRVSLDGMASCCNLQRERGNVSECYCGGSEGLGMAI